MARLTLHEATDALLQVQAWIDEHADEIIANDGELPPALAELIDQSEADFTKKVKNCGLLVLNLEAEETALATEIARLQQRKKTRVNSIKGLKTYLNLEFARAQKDKVQTPLVTVRRQRNPQPTIVALPEVTTLPERYVTHQAPYTVTPPDQINTDALLATFKALKLYPTADEVPPEEVEAAVLLPDGQWRVGDELPAGVIIEQRSHIRVG